MKNRVPPTLSKHLQSAPKGAPRPSLRIESDDQAIKLAKLHQKQGRRREAEQLCLGVLKRSPESFEALYLAGTLALDVKDSALAAKFLDRAVKVNPSHAFSHLILAEAYEKLIQPEAAMVHSKTRSR
jgi:Tfp pilus assembly protein PilF